MRISRNHPLPDGNKRLAWLALLWFLESNGVAITYTDDEAVDLMLGVAAGAYDDHYVADWTSQHME
ncbi:MAG: type II toxin-antitoxin system death-on-curing family toxin [Ilumatobacteraceae bacterium]|nr:type II toxin-antitoxin system death-on-curing family toxin [Ilumatobacteraceae bacterium]MBL6760379.1 type II toxin-antitoxin system death-on-curing family toxin [Ilumatobacteraceae bacterium]